MAITSRQRFFPTCYDKEFTDRLFGLRKRAATGNREFDRLCVDLAIEHRLSPPMRPLTNGMVEWFNGGSRMYCRATASGQATTSEQTILRYGQLYNGQLPEYLLKGRKPIDALKDWHREKPGLFKERPYNHTKCNIYTRARN